MRKAFVLDVAALTRTFPSDATCYTTPDIVDEVRNSLTKGVVDAKQQRGELCVRRPNSSFLEKAVGLARLSGDLSVVSKADLSLLALALELGDDATLLTDDFALQNIAHQRSIRVEGIFGQKIRDIVIWKKVCPVCKTSVETPDHNLCPECGATLTRKAIRKRRLG